MFRPGEERFPGSQTVPSPRARACACTMSLLDAAKGLSCCFCMASLRTGMSEAQGPEPHGTGCGRGWGGAGDVELGPLEH